MSLLPKQLRAGNPQRPAVSEPRPLVDKGLVGKDRLDRRINFYTLTRRGPVRSRRDAGGQPSVSGTWRPPQHRRPPREGAVGARPAIAARRPRTRGRAQAGAGGPPGRPRHRGRPRPGPRRRGGRRCLCAGPRPGSGRPLTACRRSPRPPPQLDDRLAEMAEVSGEHVGCVAIESALQPLSPPLGYGPQRPAADDRGDVDAASGARRRDGSAAGTDPRGRRTAWSGRCGIRWRVRRCATGLRRDGTRHLPGDRR